MAAHRTPRIAFWRRSPVRFGALLAAALAIFGTVAGVALAYWTTSGSGGASVTTGTLNPPTGVTGVQTPGTGSVIVSWTAPTTGVTPSGYYAIRKDSGNNVVAACGTSASATTSSPACTDTSVPLGTHTYIVVAVFRTWAATSAPSPSVTVGQSAQTITLTSTAPVDAVVNGPTYTVSATGGGSGNAVTFSSATPGVCTVIGSTVSFQHAGTCTVNADQAGSTYYAPADTAQQTIDVGKASQVISFTSTAPTNATVGGAYTATAAGGGSGNPAVLTIDAVSGSVCSISAGVVSFQHVGTCVVDANQAGNADYLAANQVQQSIAVGKGSQAVSFTSTAPSSAQVGGSYTPTATSTSGLTVSITLDAASTGCTLASGTVNFTAAGTCVVDANQVGDADYLPAAQMQQSFVISKINQSIAFTSTAPVNAKVGGTAYFASATATSGLTVTFGTSTPSVCTSTGTNGATISFVGAGSCTVTANQAGNGAYNAAPQMTQTFTVAKGDQAIAFTSTAPSNATVGGASYTPTATSTSGLTVAITLDASSTGCSLSGGVVSFTAVGTCKVDADQAGDTNWNAATQVQQSITVTNPAATHFSVSAGLTQTAGASFTVTITALTSTNATATGYTGNHSITLTSNAGNAPDGTAPTLPSGTVNFTAGVGTVTVTLVKAESGRTITASDGPINGTSGNITVSAGNAAKLAWSSPAFSNGTPSSPCLFTCTDVLGNNGTFTASVAVTDALGNVVSNVGAGHSVSVSQVGGGSFTAPVAGAGPESLSLPASGSAITTQPFTFKAQSGSWTPDTITAISTGYSNATATVSKQ